MTTQQLAKFRNCFVYYPYWNILSWVLASQLKIVMDVVKKKCDLVVQLLSYLLSYLLNYKLIHRGAPLLKMPR